MYIYIYLVFAIHFVVYILRDRKEIMKILITDSTNIIENIHLSYIQDILSKQAMNSHQFIQKYQNNNDEDNDNGANIINIAGIGLWPRASLLNHSCTATCSVIVEPIYGKGLYMTIFGGL